MISTFFLKPGSTKMHKWRDTSSEVVKCLHAAPFFKLSNDAEGCHLATPQLLHRDHADSTISMMIFPPELTAVCTFQFDPPFLRLNLEFCNKK